MAKNLKRRSSHDGQYELAVQSTNVIKGSPVRSITTNKMGSPDIGDQMMNIERIEGNRLRANSRIRKFSEDILILLNKVETEESEPDNGNRSNSFLNDSIPISANETHTVLVMRKS